MKKKLIGIILVLTGLFLLIIYFLTGTLIKNNINISKLNDISAEQMQKNAQKEVIHNFEAVQNLDSINVVFNLKEIDHESVVGQLFIPDLKINLPILHGVNDENLLNGVTTMKNFQEMGKGNYSLAGHNYSEKNVLLNNLSTLQEHKTLDIFITDKNKIYKYKSFALEETDAYAFNLIDDKLSEERKKSVISIMTCTIPSSDNRRIFLLGELVETLDYDKGIKYIPKN